MRACELSRGEERRLSKRELSAVLAYEIHQHARARFASLRRKVKAFVKDVAGTYNRSLECLRYLCDEIVQLSWVCFHTKSRLLINY